MLAQLNHAAHHASIVLEAAVPIRIAEHEKRGAVGAVLIGTVEETAKVRLNPEYVEVVSSRCKARGGGWVLARVQPYKDEIKSCQIIEAAVAIAQIVLVGIRLDSRIEPVLGSVEVLGLRHIQRAQDKSIHQAENHGVGADGQSQRQNGGHGETRRLAQHAESE